MVLLQKNHMPHDLVLASFPRLLQQAENYYYETHQDAVYSHIKIVLRLCIFLSGGSLGRLFYLLVLSKNMSKPLSIPTCLSKINLVLLEKVSFHNHDSSVWYENSGKMDRGLGGSLH